LSATVTVLLYKQLIILKVIPAGEVQPECLHFHTDLLSRGDV